MTIPTLRLYLLGSFQATLDGQELMSFRSDRVRALFAYLALHGNQPVARTELAELLWHGYPTPRALDSLRVALSNLRKILGPLNLFRTTFRTVQFRSDHPYFWCDAVILAQHIGAGKEIDFGRLFRAPGGIQAALFLAGFETIDSKPFQTWLLEQRTYYQLLVTQFMQQRPHISATAGTLTPATLATAFPGRLPAQTTNGKTATHKLRSSTSAPGAAPAPVECLNGTPFRIWASFTAANRN